MSVADTIEYVTLGNPVSKMVASSASALLRTLVTNRLFLDNVPDL